MGNKSVPKIITNNITDLFLSCYQHFGISNHNSLRVLLTKLLPYILFEKYIYILTLKISSPGNQQYANIVSAHSFHAAGRKRKSHRNPRTDRSIVFVKWRQCTPPDGVTGNASTEIESTGGWNMQVRNT